MVEEGLFESPVINWYIFFEDWELSFVLLKSRFTEDNCDVEGDKDNAVGVDFISLKFFSIDSLSYI